MEQQKIKYFAFISYSSKDTEWGKKVQRKLERYRMPATMCNEHGWDRNPIKPVFFAPYDSDLNNIGIMMKDCIENATSLSNSQYLELKKKYDSIKNKYSQYFGE